MSCRCVCMTNMLFASFPRALCTYIHCVWVHFTDDWMTRCSMQSEKSFPRSTWGKRLQTAPDPATNWTRIRSIFYLWLWELDIFTANSTFHHKYTGGKVKRRETDALKLGHEAFRQHQLPPFPTCCARSELLFQFHGCLSARDCVGNDLMLISSIFHWENEK